MGIPDPGFPDEPAAETASHYSGEFRSPISRWGLSGKLRPTLNLQNGMRFPVEASCGKCIPESSLRPGRIFPIDPLRETVSHLEGGLRTRFPARASKRSCGGIVPAWGFNQQKQELFHRKLRGTGWGWPSYSYRWRSRKRKARRIQGRTATCLSSLSTAVLALPSERP